MAGQRSSQVELNGDDKVQRAAMRIRDRQRLRTRYQLHRLHVQQIETGAAVQHGRVGRPIRHQAEPDHRHALPPLRLRSCRVALVSIEMGNKPRLPGRDLLR